MERDTEVLSTRDLASPNEPAGAVTTSEDDVRDVAAPEGQTARAEERTQLPVEEDARLPADGRTAAAPDEQTPPPAGEQSAPPAEARTETSATDQTVESARDQDTEPAAAPTGAADPASNAGESLLPADMDATFQERWKEIQTRFVDEPRGAVEDADGLVANLMQQLAEGFAKERERLEAQWGRGEDISTEDLRVALQRYRSFFQRLLST